MTTRSPVKKNERYYGLGGLPEWTFTTLDVYRHRRVKANLFSHSVLDAWCGGTAFLLLVRDNHRVGGTEVNRERVAYSHQVPGQDGVGLDNLTRVRLFRK